MQRLAWKRSCGFGEIDSGLWHQTQRIGHPFTNTVVLRPGPSSPTNLSIESTSPFGEESLGAGNLSESDTLISVVLWRLSWRKLGFK